MAVVLVNKIYSEEPGLSGTLVNIPLGWTAVSGNVLVVIVHFNHSSRTLSAITDNNAAAYSLATSIEDNVTTGCRSYCYYRALTASTTSVDVTLSGGTFGQDGVWIAEFSGVTGSLTGTAASGTFSSTTPSTSSITPGTANNVILGVLFGTGNRLSGVADPYNLNGDFTSDYIGVTTDTDALGGIGYRIQSSASADSYDATTDDASENGIHLIFALGGTGTSDPEGRLIGGKLIRGGLLRSGVL